MKKKKTVKKAVGKKAVKKPSEKKQTAKKEIKIKVKSKDIEQFPTEFPFWARFKVNKNRTTLIIDEELVFDKKKKKDVEGFVHRESTHSPKKDYEKIFPNPDRSDPDPMYLRRPTKKPKTQFKPHNKKLDMPQRLKERYEKNNKKKS